MADEPDQSPVEQKPELQLLMPHEYRLRDAAIDSIKNHRILSALLLIGTVLLTLMFMTAGVKDGIFMFCSMVFFDLVVLAYHSIDQLDQERRRREVFLLERASLKRDANADDPISTELMPFTRRMVVSVRPVIRHNKIPLIGGVLLILVGTVISILVGGSTAEGLECALPSTLLLGFAGGLLMLKEIVKPSEEIRREIAATQTLRQLTSEKERANLKGSLSMDTGAAGDEL